MTSGEKIQEVAGEWKEREEREERELGKAMSEWAKAQCDIAKIIRVMAYALEDANFHAEAAQARGWLSE